MRLSARPALVTRTGHRASRALIRSSRLQIRTDLPWLSASSSQARASNVSQTVGSSGTIKSSKHLCSRPGWIESILVLAMLLAPVVLAVGIMAIGFAAAAGWQAVHGMAAKLPTAASTQLYGMMAYAAACWIAVAIVWRWSSRPGIRAEVFAFRAMPWRVLVARVAAFIVAMYGVPAATHWLKYLTGGRSQDVRIDYHDARSVLTYIFLFVITAPVCEEILYRGLLVAWLRRAGWNSFAIVLAGSLLFGANHYLPLGSLVWSGAMVGLGAILYTLRLRYHSLSPGWLTHTLFNAQPFLIYPLIGWLPSGLHPGNL